MAWRRRGTIRGVEARVIGHGISTRSSAWCNRRRSPGIAVRARIGRGHAAPALAAAGPGPGDDGRRQRRRAGDRRDNPPAPSGRRTRKQG